MLREQPARAYRIWTKEETDLMINSVKSGQSITQISKLHGRSPGAITAKLNGVVYGYHLKGSQISEISKSTGLSEDQVENIIVNYSERKSKFSQPKKHNTDDIFTILLDIQKKPDLGGTVANPDQGI